MQQEPDNRLPVVIDSREQLPFFVHPDFDTKMTKTVKGLKAGDYSLLGFENQIAVERKSLADLYGSLTSDRERFEKEFTRLRDYEFSAVVVEASHHHILFPSEQDRYWRSQANPGAIWQSILSWSIKYPTRWYLLSNRRYAEAVTYDLLRHYWRIKHDAKQKTFDIE